MQLHFEKILRCRAFLLKHINWLYFLIFLLALTLMISCNQDTTVTQLSRTNNITIFGTPQTDSGRNRLLGYDTLFIFPTAPVPEGIPPCNALQADWYPSQHEDDYLHEGRFRGLYHVAIFDHIITRKMLNIFLPELNNPDADLCGVRLTLVNPSTGQVAVFYDIFNWVNDDTMQIFNLNQELHNIWGYDSGVILFPVHLIHLPDMVDYTFDHQYASIHFDGL